jgi:SAM-dependent methyltransferase
MNGNTSRSFRDKWEKNADAFYIETLREGSDTQRWILERNGFASLTDFSTHLVGSERILDAGCGNGRVTALLRTLAPEQSEVVGIDLVAADVARENFKDVPRTQFETRDLIGDLSGLGQFDFIYCQEVLHHTADPERGFRNLRELLAPGGELAIYVYKQKAPVREFVDDYIRNRIAAMPYDEAMAQCRQITEFGKALSHAGLKVNVPAVESLGIEAGEYDVQRLIYHFFAKCYWNADVSHEENVLVNYDWYHPQIATRHTLTEVEEWFQAAGLEIEHRCVDFYGITVRGRDRKSIGTAANNGGL